MASLNRCFVISLINKFKVIPLSYLSKTKYEPCHEKTCFCYMRTTRRSLNSAFVVPCLDSTNTKTLGSLIS